MITPEVFALSQVRTSGSLEEQSLAVFDSKGDWLLISRPEGVSFLAGEPELMDRVLDRAGGREAMERRFEDWAARSSVPTSVIEDVRRLAKRP